MMGKPLAAVNLAKRADWLKGEILSREARQGFPMMHFRAELAALICAIYELSGIKLEGVPPVPPSMVARR